jgi:hypothetical protein
MRVDGKRITMVNFGEDDVEWYGYPQSTKEDNNVKISMESRGELSNSVGASLCGTDGWNGAFSGSDGMSGNASKCSPRMESDAGPKLESGTPRPYKKAGSSRGIGSTGDMAGPQEGVRGGSDQGFEGVRKARVMRKTRYHESRHKKVRILVKKIENYFKATLSKTYHRELSDILEKAMKLKKTVRE